LKLFALESAKASGIGLGVFSDYAADKKLEEATVRMWMLKRRGGPACAP
jgi:hypothetical protein